MLQNETCSNIQSYDSVLLPIAKDQFKLQVKHTKISGAVSGFGQEQKQHGFHIHKYGKTGNKCSDAGGHFNPLEVVHGNIDDEFHPDEDGYVNI